ncbi:MAG TPA: aldo/keto reductase, partial [Actinomycetota bacterium]|nr:aldo/keto reductase [Actinomycetota bacterium]
SKETLERMRDRVEAYEDLCDELGGEPAIVALGWLLHQPGVTAPIIGPRTVEQLDGAQRALEVDLDDKTLLRLDEIWPGHEPAPDDYTH